MDAPTSAASVNAPTRTARRGRARTRVSSAVLGVLRSLVLAITSESVPPPTMRRDGDDRGPRRGRVARRLARERLRQRAGAHRRALLDDLGDRERTALDPGERRHRPRPRPRLPRRVPVHARCLSVDVSRTPLDDAPVRGLRHTGGDERALPLPHGARADRGLARPSTCRRSWATTPTTRARSARSVAKGSRSTRSPTWRRSSAASRSATSRPR